MKIDSWYLGSKIIKHKQEVIFVSPEESKSFMFGYVYGSETFKDGDQVCLSPIKSVRNNKVTTASGSIYELGDPDLRYSRLYPMAKDRLQDHYK